MLDENDKGEMGNKGRRECPVCDGTIKKLYAR
jgi:hypothetical protein